MRRYRLLAAVTITVTAGVFLALVPTAMKPIPGRNIAAKPDDMSIYTVYERPRDYPNGFVVRRHVVRPGVSIPAQVVGTAPSLAAARNLIPSGLTRQPRDPKDEPQIVESWL